MIKYTRMSMDNIRADSKITEEIRSLVFPTGAMGLWLNSARGMAVIAREEGVMVGITMIVCDVVPRRVTTAIGFVVSPAFRKKGIASNMANRVFEVFRPKTMYGHIKNSNPDAVLKLFHRAGYMVDEKAKPIKIDTLYGKGCATMTRFRRCN